MAKQAASTVWSIGYEGRDLEALVSELVENGVEVLADVRELPLSRKRGFSKTALGIALDEVGIDYLHLRQLGNPKSNRDGFRNGDSAAREVYMAHLNNGSRAAFDDLAELVIDRRTALMCFERDHETCHRSCVADQLGAERKTVIVEL
jgi:uncharacterized protein (DUF488 family)